MMSKFKGKVWYLSNKQRGCKSNSRIELIRYTMKLWEIIIGQTPKKIAQVLMKTILILNGEMRTRCNLYEQKRSHLNLLQQIGNQSNSELLS